MRAARPTCCWNSCARVRREATAMRPYDAANARTQSTAPARSSICGRIARGALQTRQDLGKTKGRTVPGEPASWFRRDELVNAATASHCRYDQRRRAARRSKYGAGQRLARIFCTVRGTSEIPLAAVLWVVPRKFRVWKQCKIRLDANTSGPAACSGTA